MLTEGITAASGQDEFLELLVTQLRHQDPLEPIGKQVFARADWPSSPHSKGSELNTNFSKMLRPAAKTSCGFRSFPRGRL